ncbi:MAG TPA: hypothetical protein VMF12_19445 [Xanthobacteraceae bacterium]|nr:hypothetical protein [Xanthobacteraceae bacterium]HUC64590.1 hypothetical protein [Stellaceae bacterium]
MLGEVDLWRRLAEAIVAEVDGRCDGIVSGNLDGIERYRFETGFVRGLQWVLDRAQELAETTSPERTSAEEEDEDVG